MNEGHDIGWAVNEMRHHGGKVRRAGWNGKGMFLVFQQGYPEGIPINANTAQATGIPQGTVCKFLPYVMMRTAQGDFVPWLCSQSDLLAQDWELATSEASATLSTAVQAVIDHQRAEAAPASVSLTSLL